MVYDKEYDKKYYQKNKEKIKECSKQHYQKNKEKKKQYNKQWNQKNKEKRKEYDKQYGKQYRQDNKEKIKQYKKQYNKKPEVKKYHKKYDKQYRQDHKGERNQYRREKIKKDKNFRMCCLLRCRFNKVLKRYTKTGKIMSMKSYGVDSEEIINFLSPLPENLQDYHNHHIKPLFTFNFINEDGSQNLEEIKKAFAPENHKLLLIKEHRKLNHNDLE